MKNSIIVVVVLYLIVGCAPKVSVDLSVTNPPLKYAQEVVILSLTDLVPEAAIFIGSVKVGDAGFTADCDYPVMIEKANIEARKAGGNLLKIRVHDTPDFKSTCHRITADIYYLDDVGALADQVQESAYFDSSASYAMLHIYRSGGTGALLNYKVHLGAQELCRVKANSSQSIIITREGPNELWAKTESKSAVPINIEFGKDYYLRCGVSMGFLVGRPSLTLVDKSTGKAESQAIGDK